MHKAHRQEQFSDAWLRAIASVAGCAAAKPSVDDDSVDWTLYFRTKNKIFNSPRLDIQLKSTSKKTDRECFSFALSRKNYDDLRDSVLVPRVLVIVLVPLQIKFWAEQNTERMLLRRCAYWVSLRSKPPTNNSTSVSISVNKTDQFTPAKLQGIMQDIAAGVRP